MQELGTAHFAKTYDSVYKTLAMRKKRREKLHDMSSVLCTSECKIRFSIDGLSPIEYIGHLIKDGSKSKST